VDVTKDRTTVSTLTLQEEIALTMPRWRWWRAVALGLLLSVPNAYWVMQVEGTWHSGHPTCISFFWNVGFTLMLLVFLNLAIKRLLPFWALSQQEFVVIFVILTLVSSLPGHDCLQLGISQMAMPFWYGIQNPTLRWQETFLNAMPTWLVVTDMTALRDLFFGNSSFYRLYYLQVWLPTILWWTAFSLALGAVYVGLMSLMRRQWTEHEKLSYPIIHIPLALTREGGRAEFFANKWFWWGFGVVAFLDLMNGLSAFYPSISKIPVRHDDLQLRLDPLLYSMGRPWNAAAPPFFSFPLYPFIIALGYLIPLDIAFSMWFFYLLRKVLLVITDWLGFFRGAGYIVSGPPYLLQQSYGAWLMLTVHTLWAAKHYLKEVGREIFRPTALSQQEPLSYRRAILLTLLGLGFLLWFSMRGGMSLWVALIYFGVFFGWSMAIAKCRAELGPPAHEIVGLNSANFIAHTIGMGRLSTRDKVMMPLYWWFNGRGHRNHQMPIVLEGFKMAQVTGLNIKAFPLLMVICFGVGTLLAYWAALHQLYRIGGVNNPIGGGENPIIMHNWGQLYQLQSWIEAPEPVNPSGITAIFIGAAIVEVLARLRGQFLWFPFHSAGYALAFNFGVDYFWSCLLIASVLKFFVLRYGGQRTYQATLPFMYGLVLGEYTFGAFWSAASIIRQKPIYDFAPG
jgi:hypothetical protein